jgi:ubiquinone/menaquinone biosynthesis C-methylase UbiE
MGLKTIVNILMHYEGRKTLRKKFIAEISNNNSILEIGPFYKPVCVGDNVSYFDIINQEELIERAKTITTADKLKDIPFIHFVSPIGDLSVVDKKFDAVASSHAIEHQLDLIDHLKKVSYLLHENGKYYLLVPDKRYCFDYFNNESTIADVIQATVDKKVKHSLKSVIEHRALTTHNIAKKHWHGFHDKLTDTSKRVKEAIEEYNNEEYIDVHGWYFTPTSFEKIINVLNELGYIDLKIDKIYSTRYKSFEFYVTLKKRA